MSGDGFAAKRRAEQAGKAATGGAPSLGQAMRDQAPAMTGMALMFILTILLAMSIQDFYDVDALRAFGDAGTTKAGLVLLELVFIFAFTALVIWLARRNLQRFIRWGVLGVLTIAMCYTVMPFAYALTVDDIPPLPSEATGDEDLWVLSVDSGGDGYLVHDTAAGENGSIVAMTDGGDVRWSHTIEGHQATPQLPQVSHTEDGLVMCERTRWVLLDNESGAIVDDHEINCVVGLRQEPVEGESNWETCDGVDDEPRDWSIINGALRPIPYWSDGDENLEGAGGDCTGQGGDWRRTFPEGFDETRVLLVRDIGEEHFLIVSHQWAGLAVFPDGPANPQPALVETVWETNLTDDAHFTGAAWGGAPGDSVHGENPILVLGTSEGGVAGYSVAADATVTDAFSMQLDAPVRGLLLADCCGGGSNDLWVVEGDALRVFMGPGLVEQLATMTVPGEDRVMMTLHLESGEGKLIIEDGGVWTEATYVHATVDLLPALLITILVSIVLMVVLIKHPEWYVVNTVGILVGAGVVTILGVSFVPWLIMLFMVLAAGYDAWAVYRSKHMLELADTMIGLKLPILLVAPQDKEYSFRAEGDAVMAEKAPAPSPEAEDWKAVDDAPMPKPAKGGGEAMFMGLGDVIFPGMLCISAMTFLPDVSGPAGLAAATWVAIGTMAGGLLGYLWLMTYVARGQPQAGLPLLNGGAIVGYFISAAILIGSAAFAFNVTFL